MPPRRTHTVADIWKNVDRKTLDECWPFTGKARGIKGYGRVTIAKKTYLPHRIAYIATHGSIPAGLFILHKCNNPLCCNPHHLYAGTHQDNMKDAKRHGKIGGKRPLSEEGRLKIAAFMRQRRKEEKQAKAIIARRGGFSAALYEFKN